MHAMLFVLWVWLSILCFPWQVAGHVDRVYILFQHGHHFAFMEEWSGAGIHLFVEIRCFHYKLMSGKVVQKVKNGERGCAWLMIVVSKVWDAPGAVIRWRVL